MMKTAQFIQREFYDWFNQNPKREFRFFSLPVNKQLPDILRVIARANLIGGTASAVSAPCSLGMIYVNDGQSHLTGVIRCANSSKQRPLPQIVFMDGLPLPPKGNSRDEENTCRVFWGIHQAATAMGMSMMDFIRMGGLATVPGASARKA